MLPQVRSEEIVVVGAGVIGLTTANLLQQKISERGCVTLLAAELPTPSPTTKGASDRHDPSTDYASMWAGAHYRPVPYLSPSHPSYGSLPGEKQRFHSQLAQESQWAVHTAEVMKRIAGSEPEAGVQIMSAAEFLENPSAENWTLKTGDVYASPDDNFRILDASEVNELNRQVTPDGESVKWACEYETYVVNVHVYCAWLLQRFRAKGGRVIQQRLNNFSEALGIAGAGRHLGQSKPVIVNCSGLSTNLTWDPNTKIIRGQTVLVQQQYHSTKTRQCADGVWSFLIPRPLNGGTIVGGTKQVDDYESGVRQEERQRLLENAVKYFPDFVKKVSDFTILKDNVGRRPWREGGMRIELEEIRPEGQESMSLKVVHGYGAGGRGYELSWGAAAAICKLVEQCLPQETKL